MVNVWVFILILAIYTGIKLTTDPPIAQSGTLLRCSLEHNNHFPIAPALWFVGQRSIISSAVSRLCLLSLSTVTEVGYIAIYVTIGGEGGCAHANCQPRPHTETKRQRCHGTFKTHTTTITITTTVLVRFETGSIGKSCFRYGLISLALMAALIFRPKLAQFRYLNTHASYTLRQLTLPQINVNQIKHLI